MAGYDAVVVGSGPNGLAAAVELGRWGRRVLVVEQADRIGGGTRTEELTLPGFHHDVCSAIHPLAVSSPFFNRIRLEVDWVQPALPVTHLLAPGWGVPLFRDLTETATVLGHDDDIRYRSLMTPLVDAAEEIAADFLGPLTLPEHWSSFARFALLGSLPAAALAGSFRGDAARALFAGLAAHAVQRFSAPTTAGVALLLGLVGHSHGWPFPKGGAQRIADALAARVVAQDGDVETGVRVDDLGCLPPTDLVLLDLMPRDAVRIGGKRVLRRRRWLGRRAGLGVFKVDLALAEPIPWRDEWSRQAGTVHLGGSWEEVAEAEETVHRGGHPDHPFVLLAQQSLFDPSRAPEGKHTVWAYCHVPTGSTVDMTERIEARIEQFAPGFRDLVLARHAMGPGSLERHNPNYHGGDIGGGRFDLRRVLQPGRVAPYRMGPGLFLCSSAVPPGPGVHGMSGYHAARAALGGAALEEPAPAL